MSKKGKRGGNMEMYYSTYTDTVAVDDKARFKYESLLQDYDDLFKDTEAKKRRLQKINQKKLTLCNEVRFLRKRYRKLMKNPSQQNQCVLLKRQSISVEPNLRRNHSSHVRNDDIPAETPSTSIDASLDLTQSSLKIEEDEYYLMQGEKKKNSNYNIYGEEEETTFACRDLGGTSSSRAGKRKISWQDQHPLKV